MRKFSLFLLAIVFILSMGSLHTASATLISTNGGSLVQSFGKPNTQVYGQTITAPTDNVLNNFSFWLGPTSTNFPDPANPSLSIKAYVYDWDNTLSQAMGPALYTSGVFTHNATPATPFTQYTINTGGLPLTTGNDYVLFLSTSGLAGTGRIQWELATSDEYAGGHFVFLNNEEDASLFTTSTWNSGYVPDLHFEANFSPVPEPATMLLLGTGLAGVAGAARKRKKNQA